MQEQQERDDLVKELQLTDNIETVVLEQGLNSEFADVKYEDTFEAVPKIDFVSKRIFLTPTFQIKF